MNFTAVIGQEKAVRLLQRAIASHRLGHGYLFLGPDGVGKMRTARVLAAVLVCRDPDPLLRPCGHCRGCVLFNAGNHPDFLHMLPDGGSIKIKQIRELQEKLSFAPLEADRRVVVIEDAQLMGREAANSLLKLLEEPLTGNILILVAADSESLLPTIISRCQVIPFRPLSRDETTAILLQHGVSGPQDARALAILADGSPGRALSLNNEKLLPLYREMVEGLLATQASPARTVEQGLALAARAAENREELPLLLDLLAEFFKDQCTSRLAADRAAAEDQVFPQLGEQARERWNLAALSAKLTAVANAQQALKRNCNRALVCETLLLALLRP